MQIISNSTNIKEILNRSLKIIQRKGNCIKNCQKKGSLSNSVLVCRQFLTIDWVLCR